MVSQQQELVVFAALLGSALVVMLGFGLRMIYIAFKVEGKERIEMLSYGLGAMILFGGFFAFQLWRIIERF